VRPKFNAPARRAFLGKLTGLLVSWHSPPFGLGGPCCHIDHDLLESSQIHTCRYLGGSEVSKLPCDSHGLSLRVWPSNEPDPTLTCQ
jgi:hypothetical protein